MLMGYLYSGGLSFSGGLYIYIYSGGLILFCWAVLFS